MGLPPTDRAISASLQMSACNSVLRPVIQAALKSGLALLVQDELIQDDSIQFLSPWLDRYLTEPHRSEGQSQVQPPFGSQFVVSRPGSIMLQSEALEVLYSAYRERITQKHLEMETLKGKELAEVTTSLESMYPLWYSPMVFQIVAHVATSQLDRQKHQSASSASRESPREALRGNVFDVQSLFKECSVRFPSTLGQQIALPDNFFLLSQTVKEVLQDAAEDAKHYFLWFLISNYFSPCPKDERLKAEDCWKWLKCKNINSALPADVLPSRSSGQLNTNLLSFLLYSTLGATGEGHENFRHTSSAASAPDFRNELFVLLVVLLVDIFDADLESTKLTTQEGQTLNAAQYLFELSYYNSARLESDSYSILAGQTLQALLCIGKVPLDTVTYARPISLPTSLQSQSPFVKEVPSTLLSRILQSASLTCRVLEAITHGAAIDELRDNIHQKHLEISKVLVAYSYLLGCYPRDAHSGLRDSQSEKSQLSASEEHGVRANSEQDKTKKDLRTSGKQKDSDDATVTNKQATVTEQEICSLGGGQHLSSESEESSGCEVRDGSYNSNEDIGNPNQRKRSIRSRNGDSTRQQSGKRGVGKEISSAPGLLIPTYLSIKNGADQGRLNNVKQTRTSRENQGTKEEKKTARPILSSFAHETASDERAQSPMNRFLSKMFGGRQGKRLEAEQKHTTPMLEGRKSEKSEGKLPVACAGQGKSVISKKVKSNVKHQPNAKLQYDLQTGEPEDIDGRRIGNKNHTVGSEREIKAVRTASVVAASVSSATRPITSQLKDSRVSAGQHNKSSVKHANQQRPSHAGPESQHSNLSQADLMLQGDIEAGLYDLKGNGDDDSSLASTTSATSKCEEA